MNRDHSKLKASERMKIARQAMPARDSGERATSFAEVNIGLSEQIAILEAQRCLECKDRRCVSGCPVQIDIPGFVACLAAGDLPGAAQILYRDNALPRISGRVCPQE